MEYRVRKRGLKRGALIASGVYLASSVALAAWLLPAGREQSPVAFPSARENPKWGAGNDAPLELRDLALRQARVWTPNDISAVDLGANPPDPAGILSQPMVRCRYLDGPTRGTTAKFDCVLSDGEVVKVKYGHTGEIHAELAASRLLAAVGFGADRMYIVPRVRCYGCVRTPYYTMKVLDFVHARETLVRSVPDDSYTDFEWVGVERRFDGAEIEAGDRDGWAWHELGPVDPARGANRAERDALRLFAMLLAHWDNKAPNQRLMCLSPSTPDKGALRTTLRLHPRSGRDIRAQQGGAGSLGEGADLVRPAKLHGQHASVPLRRRDVPRHADLGSRTPPHRAAARGITEPQLVALFTATRFPEFHGGRGTAADPRRWAAVFLDKVRQITEAGPCPSGA
jgi:hypothetical protein